MFPACLSYLSAVAGERTETWVLLFYAWLEKYHRELLPQQKRGDPYQNIEPFRAGVREGDWKLIWKTPLPYSIELYNIPQDPSEKTNLAAQNPEKVAAPQQRANELARSAAKPLLLEAECQTLLKRVAAPAAFPGEEFEFNEEQ